jgi:hypothetical protein
MEKWRFSGGAVIVIYCRKGRVFTMHEKKNILTYEGLRKYEDELHDLKVVKRKEVAQKIKEARATSPRTLSTTRPRTSSAILRPESRSWRKF